MKKLKVKYQVFRDGKFCGSIVRDRGGVRLHGRCGETIPDRRKLKKIVSALAAEGCVLKTIKGLPAGQSAGLQAEREVAA